MRRIAAALFALFLAVTASADPTEDQRIEALARVWAEVKFNFANFDLVPSLDWDRELAAALPRVRAAKSAGEYFRVMQELVAKLHDGHTYLWPSQEVQAREYGYVPLSTRLLEGKVIVRRASDPALDIAAGDELVAIDGVPVKQYAESRVRPYVFASTPQDSDNRTYSQWLLTGPVGSTVKLTFGNGKERTLTRVAANELPSSPPVPLVSFEVLDGNVGHLMLISFNDEKLRAQFDELWPQIEKTSALVIDIRANGGGNTSNGYHVLKTLTNKPFRGSRWRTRKYLPSNRAWGRPEQWDEHEAPSVEPDGRRLYDKPVAVLIGERTFSAAEDFAVAFDSMERGLLIGTATGGSTGQPLLIELPGGGILGVCTKRDQYPDGREFVGAGVQPDITVSPSIADLIAGKDVVLEKAVAALRH